MYLVCDTWVLGGSATDVQHDHGWHVCAGFMVVFEESHSSQTYCFTPQTLRLCSQPCLRSQNCTTAWKSWLSTKHLVQLKYPIEPGKNACRIHPFIKLNDLPYWQCKVTHTLRWRSQSAESGPNTMLQVFWMTAICADDVRNVHTHCW